MTKRLITFIIILIPIIALSQSNILLIEKNFKGVIFPNTYKNSAFKFIEESKRFTPTKEEIQSFENSLRKNLAGINKNRLNQKYKCPVIHRNLRKYVRQYLGFIDDSGKRYLLVNFLWEKSIEPESEYRTDLANWEKHWQVWFDGCSHYWNIKYYIESESLFDLQINGSS
ncbi:hypothetical protein [Flavobacterium luminosum]|uniref:Uncharacterized protein n=1 Tax=Flavobacterium luminosum TaxID=2949086 RepID=A0ABT0TRG7_9FLAO|nr:hypothetical protein [Flavobacterium sp. HXWNR70]MCL9810078.1 hypothetical protein [Flavobacterium sp. HXWNR70]